MPKGNNVFALSGNPVAHDDFSPFPEDCHEIITRAANSAKLRAGLISLWELRASSGKQANDHLDRVAKELMDLLRGYEFAHVSALHSALLLSCPQDSASDAKSLITAVVFHDANRKSLCSYAATKWLRQDHGWVDWVLHEVGLKVRFWINIAEKKDVEVHWPS